MIEVKIGDALEQLKQLPSGSVHCCVTSPPYYGLRDYSICPCAQASAGEIYESPDNVSGPSTPRYVKQPKQDCPICKGTGVIEGVKEHQLGLEKSLGEYVGKLVEVFREVRRVLRDDGTLWLNLGDCYAGSGKGYGGEPDPKWPNARSRVQPNRELNDLKPKDLCMIPARVALALQKDGWWLRQCNIWDKRNCMPENVRDRCTTSHEYIFQLTKALKYYYDPEAVREPHQGIALVKEWNCKKGKASGPQDRGGSSQWERNRESWVANPCGRNKRSVWAMNSMPYSEAHFATFPPELPETCIKAGTSSKGCCPKCGAPWERIIEKKRPEDWEDSGPQTEKEKGIRAISEGIYGGNQKSRSISDIFGRATKSEVKTLGWQPTCSCNELETIPCTVLDPFAGSGTTGMVAKKLGRSAILIELNPLYIDMIGLRTGIGVREGPLDRFPDEETVSEPGGQELMGHEIPRTT